MPGSLSESSMPCRLRETEPIFYCMDKIILKPGREQSVERFHPWIFSGAIQRIEGKPEEGDWVEVYAANRTFLGCGHYQKGSIMVRLFSFTAIEPDVTFWYSRLQSAFLLRTAAGLTHNPDTNVYRLVHGEGDGLPGLIVDIYGNSAVIQAHSAGVYRCRHQIAQALQMLYGQELQSIYNKSEGTLPAMEGNPVQNGYLLGDRGTGVVKENGNQFYIDWIEGQKTGFFIDQRENRALVSHYAKGRTVLNMFGYTGGFSVYALRGGALHVDTVDSSKRAVELALKNVECNFSPDAPHTAVAEDAFTYLNALTRNYNLIILDPPAFAKHNQAVSNAMQAYKRLNAKAIKQMAPGGILFTFSCSQAISRDQFRTALFSAAAIAGRNVRILHQLTQPADHPVNIFHPEGEYLKGLVLYVE